MIRLADFFRRAGGVACTTARHRVPVDAAACTSTTQRCFVEKHSVRGRFFLLGRQRRQEEEEMQNVLLSRMRDWQRRCALSNQHASSRVIETKKILRSSQEANTRESRSRNGKKREEVNSRRSSNGANRCSRAVSCKEASSNKRWNVEFDYDGRNSVLNGRCREISSLYRVRPPAAATALGSRGGTPAPDDLLPTRTYSCSAPVTLFAFSPCVAAVYARSSFLRGAAWSFQAAPAEARRDAGLCTVTAATDGAAAAAARRGVSTAAAAAAARRGVSTAAAATALATGRGVHTTAVSGEARESALASVRIGGMLGVAAAAAGPRRAAGASVSRAHFKTSARLSSGESGDDSASRAETSSSANAAATGGGNTQTARALQLLPYVARDVTECSQRRIHFAALLSTALSTPQQQQRVAAFLFEELRCRCALQLACITVLADLLQQAHTDATARTANTPSSNRSSNSNSSNSSNSSSTPGGSEGGLPVLRPLDGWLGEAQEALLQQFGLLLVASNALKAAKRAQAPADSQVPQTRSSTTSTDESSRRGRAVAGDRDAGARGGFPQQADNSTCRSSSNSRHSDTIDSSSSRAAGVWVGDRHFLSLVHALRCMHARVVPHVLAGSRSSFREALEQQENLRKQQHKQQQPQQDGQVQAQQQEEHEDKEPLQQGQQERETADAKRGRPRETGEGGGDRLEQTEKKIERVLEDFVLRGVSIGLLLSHFELLYHQTLHHAQATAQHATRAAAAAAEQQQRRGASRASAARDSNRQQQRQQRGCCTCAHGSTSSGGKSSCKDVGCGAVRGVRSSAFNDDAAERDGRSRRGSSCDSGDTGLWSGDSDTWNGDSKVASEDKSRSNYGGERGNSTNNGSCARRKSRFTGSDGMSCIAGKVEGRRSVAPCCGSSTTRCSVNSSRRSGGRSVASAQDPSCKNWRRPGVDASPLQGGAADLNRRQQQRGNFLLQKHHWWRRSGSVLPQQDAQEGRSGRVSLGSCMQQKQQHRQQQGQEREQQHVFRQLNSRLTQQQRQGLLLQGQCSYSGGRVEQPRLLLLRSLARLQQCGMQQQQRRMHSGVVMQQQPQQENEEQIDCLASYPAVGMIQRECSPSAEFRAAAEKVYALCCRDLGAAPSLRLFLMCRTPAEAGAPAADSSSNNRTGVGSSSSSNRSKGRNGWSSGSKSSNDSSKCSRSSASGNSRSSGGTWKSDRGSSEDCRNGMQLRQEVATHAPAASTAVASSSRRVSSAPDALMFPAAVLNYVFVELLKNAMRATLRCRQQVEEQGKEEAAVAKKMPQQQQQAETVLRQQQGHSEQGIRMGQRPGQEVVGRQEQQQQVGGARLREDGTASPTLQEKCNSSNSNDNRDGTRSSRRSGSVRSSTRQNVSEISSSKSVGDVDSRCNSETAEGSSSSGSAGVDCRIYRGPGGAWIRVSDRGVGMDARAKKAAFKCLRKRGDLLADAAQRYFGSSSSISRSSVSSSSAASSRASSPPRSSSSGNGEGRRFAFSKFAGSSYGSRSSDVHRRIFVQDGDAEAQESDAQHSSSSNSNKKSSSEKQTDSTGRSVKRRSGASEEPRLSGYGVGLILSRAYLRYFGGDLVMRSAPGEGTDVFLFLPSIETKTEVLPEHPALLQRVFEAPAFSLDSTENETFLQPCPLAAAPADEAAAAGTAAAAAAGDEEAARAAGAGENNAQAEEAPAAAGTGDFNKPAAKPAAAELWGEPAAKEGLDGADKTGGDKVLLPADFTSARGNWPNSSGGWNLVWRKPEWGTVNSSD